jgi:membrane protein required for colicin V production
VAEVLSIAGWLGAALVTLWTFGDAKPYLRQYIQMQLLADILTGVGIFVVALVIFSTISHLIARVVKGSALSAVDRSLGFVFGIARGAVLVCLAYLLLTWVVPETRRPPWLENARMLPWVQAGAEYLKSLVPQEALAGAIDKAKQEAPALAPQIADPIGSLLNQNQVQPQGQPPAPAPAPAQPQPARPPAPAPASPGITPTHPTPTH